MLRLGFASNRKRIILLVMNDDLYNQQILHFAQNIPHHQRLNTPQASARKSSRLCGSRVTVDIALDRTGAIRAFGQEVKACALGNASAAILAQNILGRTAVELRETRRQLDQMLKNNAPPPNGIYADLAVLKPAIPYKTRHTAILLAWDAVIEALDMTDQQKMGHAQ